MTKIEEGINDKEKRKNVESKSINIKYQRLGSFGYLVVINIKMNAINNEYPSLRFKLIFLYIN